MIIILTIEKKVVTILFDIWRGVGINKEGQGKGGRGGNGWRESVSE